MCAKDKTMKRAPSENWNFTKAYEVFGEKNKGKRHTPTPALVDYISSIEKIILQTFRC